MADVSTEFYRFPSPATILRAAPFLPLIVVTVLGAMTIATTPANNGISNLRLFFCAVPAFSIVNSLRIRPWLAAIASLPLALLIQVSVNTGQTAPLVIPFLVMWCGGWYRQERAKGRNPWPLLSIVGTFLFFAICSMIVMLSMGDPFANDVTHLPKDVLTRVELRMPDGRSGAITEPAKLEEARLALRQTYPYFRNRENWTRQYDICLFVGNAPTPYRVLPAQIGNVANAHAFWIIAPEGEFQNVALYDLMYRQGLFETVALERLPVGP